MEKVRNEEGGETGWGGSVLEQWDRVLCTLRTSFSGRRMSPGGIAEYMGAVAGSWWLWWWGSMALLCSWFPGEGEMGAGLGALQREKMENCPPGEPETGCTRKAA